MKKFVTTLAAASLLTLAGCSSSASTSNATNNTTEDGTFDGFEIVEVDLSNADGVLADILDAGVLSIATSPDFPPAEFITDEGEVAGAEIKMAQYVAAVLGVELNIEQMDFAAVLTAVDTGKVNLGMSGFGYKKDRAENFELTHGYIGSEDSESSCHGLLVPTEDLDKYETLEDFSGLTIAAQASSLQEMYATDQIPNVNIEQVQTLDQAILNLASGKIDAAALSCTSGNNYAANSNGAYTMSSVIFDLTPYETYKGTVAVAKKGEESLVEVLNVIIDFVNENKMYEVWYEEAKEQAGIE